MTTALPTPAQDGHQSGCWREPGHERCALRAAMRLHQQRAQHADQQARALAATARESSQLAIQFRGGVAGDPTLSLIDLARNTLIAETEARKAKRLAVVKDPAPDLEPTQLPTPPKRRGGARGSAHPRATLTFEQVQEIRRRWVPNDRAAREALQEEFGISRTGIYKIVNFETRVDS